MELQLFKSYYSRFCNFSPSLYSRFCNFSQMLITHGSLGVLGPLGHASRARVKKTILSKKNKKEV